MDEAKIRAYVAHIRADCDGIEGALNGAEPPPANTITVKPGDDLQKAFDSLLTTGGIIRARPGEYFTTITLPERQSTKPIVFTTDTENLPNEGVRISPDYQPGLAILRSANKLDAPFTALPKSRGVSFLGCGFGPMQYDRIVVYLGTDTETQAVNLPKEFLFDRVFFYGDPQTGQHRGIMAHADGLKVLSSYFQDFHEEGRDSQCLAAWNGGRNIEVDNCYLEAGAENILFGGSDAKSVEMIPQDIKLTRNLFSKPLRWKTTQASIKNLLELKNCLRVHIEGNVFDGCWSRDWPSGVAVVFKVSPNGSKFTECQDVMFVNNVIRNVGAVFSVVGSRDGGEPSGRMKNVTIQNNLAYKIAEAPYTGDARHLPIANPPIALHVQHNTVHGNAHSFMNWWWDSQQETGQDLVMTDNCADHGAYGIHSSYGLGTAALDKGWPQSYKVTSNALKKHPDRTAPLPAGNQVIAATGYDASFGTDQKVIAGSAVANVKTTDGQMIGADIDAIKAALAVTENV